MYGRKTVSMNKLNYIEKPFPFCDTFSDISIEIRTEYMEEESSPYDDVYVWAYYVRIHNKSNQRVQVLDRNWSVVEASGVVYDVEGEGLAGEQPLISSKASYEYHSYAVLQSSSGMLNGYYKLVDQEGKRLNIPIPVSSFDMPNSKPVLN